MPRTPEQNREYMRAYRARKEGQAKSDAYWVREEPAVALKRIAELEEEVHHLKEELAKRPDAFSEYAGKMQAVHDGGFNTRPFTPVPKKS